MTTVPPNTWVEAPPCAPPDWITLAPPIIPGGASTGFVMEGLAVTSLNHPANLSQTPDGAFFLLIVNGQTFLPVSDPAIGSAPFGLSGVSVLWTSTVYSLNPGDSVMAVYTYRAA